MDDDVFCSNCGTPIVMKEGQSTKEENQAEPETVQNQQPVTNKNHSGLTEASGFRILAAVGAIIVIAALVLPAVNQSMQKQGVASVAKTSLSTSNPEPSPFGDATGTNLLLDNKAASNLADPKTVPAVKIENATVTSNCVLPPVWGEVGNIFKNCQLKEVEKGSGYEDSFNPEGANGIFSYCNTLVFRHYQTSNGDMYTYEKVLYTHLPVSEAGEYRITKKLFDAITNSRRCIGTQNRWGNLSDDDLSSDLFPSRNYKLGRDLPAMDVLSVAKNAESAGN